jgi:predicted amidophosphoribosyltransferase
MDSIVQYCPECGKQNERDATSCIHCSKDFKTLSESRRELIIGGIIVTTIGVIWFLIGLLGNWFYFFPVLMIIIGPIILLIGLFIAPRSIICPKCNSHVPPDFTYCRNCGTLMKFESSK